MRCAPSPVAFGVFQARHLQVAAARFEGNRGDAEAVAIPLLEDMVLCGCIGFGLARTSLREASRVERGLLTALEL